jgi:general secretion pathway protein A
VSAPHPYLEHWGLAEAPFLVEPDLRFAFERADHREGLARILFGLTQLGGIVMITGEIGCGKTLLLRAVERTLDGGPHHVVVVANPPRTATALLDALSARMGEDGRSASSARAASRVRGRLAEAEAEGRHEILAVDEAQRLDARALDELRMLTNPDEGPAAPIVLLGQPELGPRVGRQRQVDQRVAVRYHLAPMDRGEVVDYIAHRCRVAGATHALFSERAALAVHDETGGVPRLVNLLCANALFVGYAREENEIGEDTVRDVAEDRSPAVVEDVG